MNGRRTTVRSHEREALKRQKLLERSLKEIFKLSALEQARLEVERHQNGVEVLLSVHKDQSLPVDWSGIASSLAPHPPPLIPLHELHSLLRFARHWNADSVPDSSSVAAAGQTQDLHQRVVSMQLHEDDLKNWQEWRQLARRVLEGDTAAYTEAINALSTSLTEVSNLGSSLSMEAFSEKVMICSLTVKSRDIIPTELKSLTVAGKLSSKPMPKGKFHEIYQDYVCSCVLRLGREVFALLPVMTIIINAAAEDVEGHNQGGGLPVLSLMIHRDEFTSLDFEHLDPSDTIERFAHRGDVKVSRKSDQFVPIIPFTENDLLDPYGEHADLNTMLSRVRELRHELAKMSALIPKISKAST